MIIRVLDILFSLSGMLIGSPVLLIIFITGYRDTGSPLFFQQRVGRNKKPFILVKFRTMRVDTPNAASHLVGANAITNMGKFLRRTKLDELPQLWNVLIGDMSLVGPRPCLFSQEELINARDVLGVYGVRPGITGIAQLRSIDMSTPELLARTDAEWLNKISVTLYLNLLVQTVLGRGRGDAASKP